MKTGQVKHVGMFLLVLLFDILPLRGRFALVPGIWSNDTLPLRGMEGVSDAASVVKKRWRDLRWRGFSIIMTNNNSDNNTGSYIREKRE